MTTTTNNVTTGLYFFSASAHLLPTLKTDKTATRILEQELASSSVKGMVQAHPKIVTDELNKIVSQGVLSLRAQGWPILSGLYVIEEARMTDLMQAKFECERNLERAMDAMEARWHLLRHAYDADAPEFDVIRRKVRVSVSVIPIAETALGGLDAKVQELVVGAKQIAQSQLEYILSQLKPMVERIVAVESSKKIHASIVDSTLASVKEWRARDITGNVALRTTLEKMEAWLSQISVQELRDSDTYKSQTAATAAELAEALDMF